MIQDNSNSPHNPGHPDFNRLSGGHMFDGSLLRQTDFTPNSSDLASTDLPIAPHTSLVSAFEKVLRSALNSDSSSGTGAISVKMLCPTLGETPWEDEYRNINGNSLASDLRAILSKQGSVEILVLNEVSTATLTRELGQLKNDYPDDITIRFIGDSRAANMINPFVLVNEKSTSPSVAVALLDQEKDGTIPNYMVLNGSAVNQLLGRFTGIFDKLFYSDDFKPQSPYL